MQKLKFTFLFCLVFLILMPLQIVRAITYSSDDFENFPTGWNAVGNIAKSGMQYHGGSYSAYVNSVTSTSQGYAYQTWGTATTDDFHIEIWIFVNSTYQANDIILIETCTSSTTNFALISTIKYVTDHFDIRNSNGASSDTVCSITPDVWNEVDIFVLYPSRKARYYLNDVFKGEFQGYSNNTNQQKCYFGDVSTTSGAGNGRVFYDDFLVDTALESNAYIVDMSQSMNLVSSLVLQWNSQIGLSESISVVSEVFLQWASIVDLGEILHLTTTISLLQMFITGGGQPYPSWGFGFLMFLIALVICLAYMKQKH